MAHFSHNVNQKTLTPVPGDPGGPMGPLGPTEPYSEIKFARTWKGMQWDKHHLPCVTVEKHDKNNYVCTHRRPTWARWTRSSF